MAPGQDAEMLARMNQIMVRTIPLNAALGLVVEAVEGDLLTMRLPYRADLVGNPETGVLHGGVITSLLDACSGLAVMVKTQGAARIATLDLRIDYLKPATPPRDVIGRCQCTKLTRHVAFVRGLAYHDDPDDPIAAAAGTFVIFTRGPKA